MAEFLRSFIRTDKYEGGYAKVKGDKGGETYRGISRVHHPKWEGWHILDKHKPLKYNQRINDEKLDYLVSIFFLKNYWNKIWGDQIDSQKLAELIYDYYVHSGNRAIKSVQKIVDAHVDGIMGNNTLKAINSSQCLFEKLKAERKQFLYDISEKDSQRKFRKGWIERIDSFV